MPKRCYGCMKMKESSPICEHCGFNENIENLSHQLPLGTVLRDQYLVGKVLGQGGFGITYMGWDLNLDIPIAIKEYFPNGFVNRECSRTLSVTSGDENRNLFQHNRERFLREARALAKLRDVSGIVRVHNFFQENDTAYIIMEYVEGIDLKRFIWLQGRTLTPAEIFTVLRPVMESMGKVHSAGLVHRDISPDNIMVQPDGSAKLLDFGAVREVVDADADKNLSQATEAILKQGFAPMEQYQNRGSLGPWTDVYALCATMYYCMTGKVPPDAPARLLEGKRLEWDTVAGLNQQQISALEHGMAILPRERTASTQILLTELYPNAVPSQPSIFQAPIQNTSPSVQQSTYQAPQQSIVQPAPEPESAVLENDFRNAYNTAPATPAAPMEYPSHTIPLEVTEPSVSSSVIAATMPVISEEAPAADPIAPTAPVQRTEPVQDYPSYTIPLETDETPIPGDFVASTMPVIPKEAPVADFIAPTMPVQREEPIQPVTPVQPKAAPVEEKHPVDTVPAAAAPKKKPTALIAVIGGVAAVVFLLVFLLTGNSRAYSKAEKCMENGNYSEAATIYRDLAEKGYQDSYQKFQQARYHYAKQMLKDKQFQQALDQFTDLSFEGYSAADGMIAQTQYQWASELIDQKDYVTALNKLKSVQDLIDCDALIEQASGCIYSDGQQAYRAGHLDKAKECFDMISGYQDTASYQRLIFIRKNGETYAASNAKNPPGVLLLETYLKEIREDFYFEDTAEVLVSSTELACKYLLGKWHTSNFSHYLEFTTAEDGGYYTSYNIPWLEGEYFYIQDGCYYMTKGNVNNVMYRLKLTGPDTMEVYAAKDGKTYYLVRDVK